ncbi:MAG TPA: response regulator, partial [Gemmataceae bacterium]|nr:response regulator [Gemmataceae bacterium]
SCLIFATPYAINRTGRVGLAVHMMLAGNVLVILASALINRTAIPAVFFMGLLVVVAGAFGQPRTPLLWATVLTGVPFLINVLLYGALIAPTAPLTTPEGFTMQPIWRLELVALGLLWLLAGASALATWLLGGAVGDSHAAAATAIAAQQALMAHQADLAQQNTQLVQAQRRLETANAALAHAARHKDEFLASMSHELRTPLNTILGMAETLQEGVFGTVNAEQIDAVRHIDESGRHLLALINDILDLSKVEAGKLDLDVEEVVIAPVCQASLRLVKQTAHQKRLSVTLNIDSAVTVLQADARRLKQMLVNLLSNAVKFTPEGGAVGLDVVGDTAAQCVRLTVWDTGIGIAADDLPRVFQPFVQIDSRLARQYTGTGLGLALVDEMAALHGGSLTVESTLGQGSRFTITLPRTAVVPVSAPVATSDLATPALVRGATLQRALVIEDSPPSAAQLARYVRELGAEAHVHPCGAGALEAALDVRPDVILLDIQLPDRSGWDVLAQLKADPRVHAIPVVVVSVVDDRPQGLALGAAGYLVKPIARQQLQETLATIVSCESSQTVAPALLNALEPPPVAQRPVILLAEDDENNIRTLTRYLAAKEYQVVVARNGAEALSHAHAAPPALILMDIQMPGMDGLEAIRRIRASSTLAAIPIIALTALAMVGDRERCLAAGANDYLSKPVRLQELVRTIEAHRTTDNADVSREH